MRITRHFLPLADGRQIHYRRAGAGPPLILLHPSPSSSAAVMPAIEAFADLFTCIALDTPGYGLSDDVVDDPVELRGYVTALEQTLAALSIGACAIYGAATGGQIGIQFAREHPSRIPLLMLDSIGDFADDLEHIASGYFQDITPASDGSHLFRVWDMCRNLTVMFPWHSVNAADRLNVPVAEPEAIQLAMNDYLRAGPNYAKAYRPAMEVERWEITRQVTVPTLLVHNRTSAVSKHTERLIAKGLPANFTVVSCERNTRLEKLRAAAKPLRPTLPTPPAAPKQTSDVARMQNMHIAVTHGGRSGDLRARVNLAGSGRPILALHDPAGSSALVEPILSPYVGRRPVIALDLPGNGESDNIVDPAAINSAAYAEIVVAAMAALGLDGIDVIGRYSGAPVGMEMAFQKPTLVKHLIQAPFMLFEGAEQADLLANYTPSVAPKWDGSHLATAWGFMRDQSLFWPWYNRTPAGIIRNHPPLNFQMTHLRVVELLKIGDQYRQAYAAAWTYPMRDRLPKLPVPTLIAAPDWESLAAKSALVAGIAPHVPTAALPPRMADWHRVFDAFLGT